MPCRPADTAASAAEHARQRGLPLLWRSLRLHRPAGQPGLRGSPVKAAARAGSPASAAGGPGESPAAAPMAEPPGARDEEAAAGLAAAVAERAYDALALAAPTKGEVLPWVWLLRAFAARWSVASMATSIAYLARPRQVALRITKARAAAKRAGQRGAQARVAKHVAPEAEWLRLLGDELQPVLAHLHDNLPSRSARSARPRRRRAARRAAGSAQRPARAQACRRRCRRWRTAPCRRARPPSPATACTARRAPKTPPSCGRPCAPAPNNPAPRPRARRPPQGRRAQVRVVALVTRCAVTDGAGLSGLLEAQLLAAAQARCRALLAAVGALPMGAPKAVRPHALAARPLRLTGRPAGGAGWPASPAAGRSLRGLAAAAEALAQDIADDAEVYQAALPAACGLSLPAIAARRALGPSRPGRRHANPVPRLVQA